MKKYVFLVCYLFINILFIASMPINPKVINFFDDPFTDNNYIPPRSLKTLEEIYKVLGAPNNIEEKDLINKYDPKLNDKRFILHYDQLSIYIDYYDIKKEYFRTLYCINDLKLNLKYGITEGMSSNEIISIFGNYDRKAIFDKNYNLCYSVDDFGIKELQFSFTNSDQLNSIFLWISP